MHDIEPYYKWRELYIASEDDRSPFFGTTYNEFSFTEKIYNYYIHPQWDNMGSTTLYLKIIYVDYHEGYAIIELIGEWNDAVGNDIMFLKRNIADKLIQQGISNFILMCDNVLNFHADEDCYYQEWKEDLADNDGWVFLVNLQDHVYHEMTTAKLQDFVFLGDDLDEEWPWQSYQPKSIYQYITSQINISQTVK